MDVAASDLTGARLGSGDSIRRLIGALADASPTLQMFHGPEAIAEGLRVAGQASIDVVEAAARSGGVVGVAAARALWLANMAGAEPVVRAAELALAEPSVWWHGVFLAGEVGRRSEPLAPRLAEIFELCRGLMPSAAQAYARTAGASAVTRVKAWLGDAELAAAAARAAGGLGCVEELVEPLGALLRGAASLEASTAAIDALCRTCRHVEEIAVHAHVGLSGDRWLRMWTLRRLAELGQRRLGSGDARDPLRRDWWGTFLRGVPLANCGDGRTLTELIVSVLDDPDTDVVRNAIMAVAAIGAARQADAIRGLANERELSADVADALFALGAASSPSAVTPIDLYLPAPEFDREAAGHAAAELRGAATRTGGPVGIDESEHNYALLALLAEDSRLIFHGSAARGLSALEPTRMGTSDNPLTDQVGVFGDVDPVIPHFYAVVDRTRSRSITNGRHDSPRGTRYHLALDLHAVAARTFTPGSVYVVPRDTFTLNGEWASPTAVAPIAEIRVRAEDFPLLADLWSSDLGQPINDAFAKELTALWHTAHFPSRST